MSGSRCTTSQDFTSPSLSTMMLKVLYVVGIHSGQKAIYAASKSNEICCYKVGSSKVDHTITISSEHEIQSISMHKSNNWLLAKTVNQIFIVDTKDRRVQSTFETHKLPALGSNNYNVDDILGCVSNSKKLVMKTQEVGEDYKGCQTVENSIEICKPK